MPVSVAEIPIERTLHSSRQAVLLGRGYVSQELPEVADKESAADYRCIEFYVTVSVEDVAVRRDSPAIYPGLIQADVSKFVGSQGLLPHELLCALASLEDCKVRVTRYGWFRKLKSQWKGIREYLHFITEAQIPRRCLSVIFAVERQSDGLGIDIQRLFSSKCHRVRRNRYVRSQLPDGRFFRANDELSSRPPQAACDCRQASSEQCCEINFPCHMYTPSRFATAFMSDRT